MNELKSYLYDGANTQARAVMCFIQDMEIEDSWDDAYMEYSAKFKIARWKNCKEQGYIISLNDKTYTKQLNIIFYEHRDYNSICAVKWEQKSLNSLTIETAKFGDIFKDKNDISFTVGYGKIAEMARWIEKEFNIWWTKNN